MIHGNTGQCVGQQVILRDRELPSVVFGPAFARAVPGVSCFLDDLAIRIFYIAESLRGPDLFIEHLTLLRR